MSPRTKGQKSLCCPGTKGQRDRSRFIVPGQRDNGTSSKSCHGTGWDSLSKSGTGQAGPGHRSLSRDFCSCHCHGTKRQRDKKTFLSQDKETMGRPVLVCPGTVPVPVNTSVVLNDLKFYPHDTKVSNIMWENVAKRKWIMPRSLRIFVEKFLCMYLSNYYFNPTFDIQ